MTLLLGHRDTDELAQAQLLLGVEIRADLVRIVELEQLPPLGLERDHLDVPARVGAGRCSALRALRSARADLAPDRLPEWRVVTEQSHPQDDRALQGPGSPSGHGAVLAAMLAAEHGLAVLPVLDGSRPRADATSDTTG